MAAHAELLLGNLFGAMRHKGSEENEYLMKAIMRTMSLLQEKMIGLIDSVVKSLTEKLIIVAKVGDNSHCFLDVNTKMTKSVLNIV